MVKHPITGEAFDYEHICKTCIYFHDKTRTVRGTKYRDTRCDHDPKRRNLAEFDRSVSWSSLPACSKHHKENP